MLRGLADGDLLSLERLAALVAEMLVAAGMPASLARQAAARISDAHRDGNDTHGVMHLPFYLRRLRSRAMSPDSEPTARQTGPSVAVVEGNNCLGMLVGDFALNLACDLAARTGVGIVSVRDSNHLGALGPYVRAAAARNMVAVALSNAAPSVAPWGGRTRALGTNPIAAAFPRQKGAPVVIDMATTAASRGSLRKAMEAGERIPAGWALDRKGIPTDDPAEGLAGVLLPAGGPKGYALSVMIELLCSALSGGREGMGVLPPTSQDNRPAGTSHFFLALDPAFFYGRESAREMVERIAGLIKDVEPVDVNTPVRLPGERAADMAGERSRVGIPLTRELLRALRQSAEAAYGSCSLDRTSSP
jgi:LDH2 family malate/lactate/ureidoglycolate dehydrogenase